jgi:hypothetical protein
MRGNVLLAAVVLATGCASITAKPTDTLYVSSNPPGAQVLVSGTPRGPAPLSVEIDRRNPEVVNLALPGYQTQDCNLRMSAGTGYVVADVVLCVLLFPIGCVSFIDANGSWNELEFHSCNLNLQPGSAQSGYPAPPPQGYPYPPPQNYPPPPQSYPVPPPQNYPPQAYPPPAPPNGR